MTQNNNEKIAASQCGIYLLSQPTWQESDFFKLEEALKTGLVSSFQVRLPDEEKTKLEKISADIVELCHQHSVMCIINNDIELALKTNADGVHIGSSDGEINIARKKLGAEKILGVSCYDSTDRALIAGDQGANYVSFGTFFPSPTKNSGAHPKPEILRWWSEAINIPCVAIGGINAQNCAPLVQAGADFLAVVSSIWQHPQGMNFALQELHNNIQKNLPTNNL